MIQGKIIKDDKNLSEIFKIWEKVFDKPENYYIKEDENLYIILYEGLKEDYPIGAAKLKISTEACLIENLAIIEEKRNQKNGEFLLRYTIDKGFQSGNEIIYAVLKETEDKLFKRVGFIVESDINQQNNTKYKIIRETFYNQC